MKLQEIEEMWSNDAHIDPTDLIFESLRIPKLHAKYYRLFNQERMIMATMISDHKQLKLEKFEFYTQGPTSETPSDWALPDIGRILKTESPRYLDADKHIRASELKITMQTEKVNFLQSIIESLKTRNFVIKNAIDLMKFQAGA